MFLLVSNRTCGGLRCKPNVNSAHLKEGESINANNWETEFGSNEAVKEMVEHVGKHCSHFVTAQHKFIYKKKK